jgi:hypothetical protein
LLWRTISPDANNIAGGVPVSKNGRILRFSEHSFMNHSFINPKGWDFSPTIRIGDFASLQDGQTAAKC